MTYFIMDGLKISLVEKHNRLDRKKTADIINKLIKSDHVTWKYRNQRDYLIQIEKKNEKPKDFKRFVPANLK